MGGGFKEVNLDYLVSLKSGGKKFYFFSGSSA